MDSYPLQLGYKTVKLLWQTETRSNNEALMPHLSTYSKNREAEIRKAVFRKLTTMFKEASLLTIKPQKYPNSCGECAIYTHTHICIFNRILLNQFKDYIMWFVTTLMKLKVIMLSEKDRKLNELTELFLSSGP